MTDTLLAQHRLQTGLETKVTVHCQKGQLGFLYIVVLFCTILRGDLVVRAQGRVGCRAENRTRNLPKRTNKEWSGGFYSASGRSPPHTINFVR